MQVREAVEGDIPSIVGLLKLSLGESLMPKSEQYWRWKHQDNPFGPSPVFLCFDGRKLVGVRAFMRWEWTARNQIYRALRAVDTATHPEYQGKGIFKKLTMALVNVCQKNNNDFIFNTPNRQSKPGYLKMGWEEAGRVPIGISIQRPFTVVKNLLVNPRPKESEKFNLSSYFDRPDMENLVEICRAPTTKISTNITLKYLKWRYQDVPVANYVAIGTEVSGVLRGLIIGRIKNSRLGRELRITNCFVSDKETGRQLHRHLLAYSNRYKVDYCTFSGTSSDNLDMVFGSYHLKFSVGPIVTIRSLALENLSTLKNFSKWSPSLGDLELF